MERAHDDLGGVLMRAQTLVLNGPQDAATVAQRAEWVGYPCTVSIRKGVQRSGAQNRLAQQWASDVSAQLGDRTPEQVRGHFKLHHGVPIRREDEAFAAVYDRVLRPLPYADKLLCMMVPIDMPVTRDMSKNELSRYLESIWQEFSKMGVVLTNPDERGLIR